MKKFIFFTASFLLFGCSIVYGTENCNRYEDVIEAEQPEYEDIYQFCKTECYKGNLNACANLSYIYLSGKGTRIDYKIAYELAKETCEKNIGFGCYNLGLMYQYIIEKDYKKAAKFYEKACNLNVSLACTELGNLYLNGHGVRKNYKKALKYFEKACKLGDKEGCEKLGYMYQYGIGIKKNYRKALKFYEKACNMGNQNSCFNWSNILINMNKTITTKGLPNFHYPQILNEIRRKGFSNNSNNLNLSTSRIKGKKMEHIIKLRELFIR